MITIPVLSTEYVGVQVSTSVNGAPFNPTVETVQFAFMIVGPPSNSDWQPGVWEIDPGPGYFAKCLIGPGPGGFALPAGVYTMWIKINGNAEIPVQPIGLLNVISTVDQGGGNPQPTPSIYGVLAQSNTWTAVNSFPSVTLAADPTQPLQAATKHYVDVSTGSAPATPTSLGTIQLAGDISGTATAPTVTGTHLAAPLPLAQGGTGSATQNFVDLSNPQTVAGTKTFTSAPAVPSAAFPESAVAGLVSDLSTLSTAVAAKVPLTRAINTSTGLSGGGALSGDLTLTATDATTGARGIVQLAGDLAGTATAPTVPGLTGKTPTSRVLAAGTGLTGGGDLTADRTFTVSYGTGVGTAAQGNDSRITGAVQSSTATTKGDLLVATAANTLARQGVGSDGQYLVADSAQTTGVKWGTVNAGGEAFPTSQGYGLSVISDHPMFFQNVSSLTNATVFGARCWVPANTAISNLAAAVRTGGTYASSAVPNQFGLYDDTGTQVHATVDDNTLWNNAGWAARSITTVTAQGTGRFVYILYILGGFTGVNVPYALGANDLNAPWLGLAVTNSGNRRAFYLNGQSALPASFTPSSVGTNTGFIPLVGAY